MMKSNPSLTSVVAGTALLMGAHAHGAGFAIVEQSVTGLGSAFAGGAASAQDASTVYFNPAGMSRLGESEYDLGLHVISPYSQFRSDGTSNVGGVVPLRGGDGGEAGVTGFIPNFYYVRRLNSDFSFGLGVNAPFGLATDYNEGWEGRYHALKSEVVTVNINPSLSWKVSDRLSLGAGINVQYADVPELSNAIDFATVCRAYAASSNPTVAASAGTCAGLPTSRDGKVKLNGDDWSLGFNLGLLYQFTDATRVGVAYRSKVDHKLEGRADFTNTPTGLSNLGIFVDDAISANITLPETLSLSAYHDLGPRWAVMGDVTWTRWDRFDELRVKFKNNPQGDLVTPEQWDNSFRYSLGLSYRYNDRWTFRTGAAYDETPVPSAQLRTPRIPGNDRRWLALGASYRVSDHTKVDVGYAHLFVNDSPINNTNSTGATLNGSFDLAVDIFSAQVRMTFD